MLVGMNTFHLASEAVAAEVRAEMGRQRKTQAELASVLGITTATAARRLSGAVPFDVVELMQLSEWLDIDAAGLMPSPTHQAAS